MNGTLQNLEIGNTEVAAGMIQKFTGADIFQIEPVQPYVKGYNACIAQAQEDQRRDARPELKRWLESIEEYDTIYLGFPKLDYGLEPYIACIVLKIMKYKYMRHKT